MKHLGQALATAITRAPGLDIGPGAAATTRKVEARSTEDVKEIMADAAELIQVLDLKTGRPQQAPGDYQNGAIRLAGSVVRLPGIMKARTNPVQSRLSLHPYRLCLIKNAWYLIAKPTDEESPRTYRIARFKTLNHLDQPADVPEDFDIKGYFGNAWAVFCGDKQLRHRDSLRPQGGQDRN